MDTAKAERAALYVAVVVIIVLTGAAFWLSYAHLADVAGDYGLGDSPVRRWAWPATLDLFIVAGEVLMFRAALRKHADPWAIGLTVVGSLGSIALNVAGVGARAAHLDYVVAAVPPAAALLAFGALMRQVHVMVTTPAKADTPVATPDTPVATVPVMPDTEPDTVTETDTEDAPEADTDEPPADTDETPDTEPDVVDMDERRERKTARRGRTEDEILSAVRFLEDSGQEVNGTTYAAHIGDISARTGRRDLTRAGITTA